MMDLVTKSIHVKTTESYLMYLMRMLTMDNEARKLLWLNTEEILEELGLGCGMKQRNRNIVRKRQIVEINSINQ
ncbi:hypothetical protein IIC_04820 [Bacillus cereus VD021]|uniref:Uncharacterized protein n=1 Tax=Bacillus cereus VD021 TaxID=1053224 RepID=R8HAY0_BACCE|nr:hypothetical protein IIC_04820 [Bacillus cereus VD021]